MSRTSIKLRFAAMGLVLAIIMPCALAAYPQQAPPRRSSSAEDEKIEKIREAFSMGYKAAKESGVIVDKQTRNDLEFVDRTLNRLKERYRQVDQIENKLQAAGASEAQINKTKLLKEELRKAISQLPQYEIKSDFLTNLSTFKELSVKRIHIVMDNVDKRIDELRKELPEIIGTITPEGEQAGGFARVAKNAIQVTINDIVQYDDEAELVFLINDQPVKKGDEITVMLKGENPVVPMQLHIRDEWARYLEKSASEGKMESSENNRLFWHEQVIQEKTVQSTWYPYEEFTVTQGGQGAHNIRHIARGAAPDKRFGDPFKGNVAEISFSGLPAQNIELTVEGTITWKRETGPVGAKLAPRPREPAARAKAVLKISCF